MSLSTPASESFNKFRTRYSVALKRVLVRLLADEGLCFGAHAQNREFLLF